MIAGLLPGLSMRLPTELMGARSGIQMFTASGTFTMPSGVSSVTAMALGIGGGGGGASGKYSDGGGTTAGADGSAGGTTTLGVLLSAAGGSPGKYNTANATSGHQVGARGFNSITAAFSGDARGIHAPGGVGLLGFGTGGTGGSSVDINNPIASISVLAGNGGNSGAPATYFGAISANQTVTIGAGGAKGLNAHSANAAVSEGQDGASGFVIVLYWW